MDKSKEQNLIKSTANESKNNEINNKLTLDKKDELTNINKNDQLDDQFIVKSNQLDDQSIDTSYQTKFNNQNNLNQPIKISLIRQNSKLLSYSAPTAFKSPTYQLTSENCTEQFIEENLKKFNRYHNQENLIDFLKNLEINNDLINCNLNNDQNMENKINLSDEYIKVNLDESNIEYSYTNDQENNLINTINCNLDNSLDINTENRKNSNVLFNKDESIDEIETIPTNFSVASLTNDFPISDIYQIAREIKRTYLLKILILGDSNTGKTSFVKRLTCNSTPRHYMPTIGLEYSMKIIETDEQKEIRLQIYDISGEKNQDSLTKLYFRDAYGALIFFDCNKESTFKNVNKWKAHLDANVRLLDNSKLPTILIANKCDLKKNGIAKDSSMLEKFCHQFEFDNYFFTSAKTNQNINKAVESLIRLIFESRMEFHYNQEMNIKLEDSDDNRKSGFRCFC